MVSVGRDIKAHPVPTPMVNAKPSSVLELPMWIKVIITKKKNVASATQSMSKKLLKLFCERDRPGRRDNSLKPSLNTGKRQG